MGSWSMSEQRIQDIATLARSALLSKLPMDEIGLLLGQLTPITLSRGALLDPAADTEPALHFVLEGELELNDGQTRLGPGDVLGETALAGTPGRERAVAKRSFDLNSGGPSSSTRSCGFECSPIKRTPPFSNT